MISQALTVSDYVSKIQETVRWNPSLKNVALVGELSNFHAHRSGHFYFTLKDDKARIDAVMFASFAQKVLFKPKDGDKVLVYGYTDVYLPQGRVQFYAQKMNLDGLGDLHLRYEALKKRYYEQGAFAIERKQALPEYPEKIAVITAKGSAAWADIEKTLRKRWPLAQVIARFAYVQGEKAKQDLVEALDEVERLQADVIIMARGGGSIEDLWAFNEPIVIDRILTLSTPIISAIGHESDTTLAELASDHRAATPTAAAVAACPDQKDVFETIRNFKNTYYLKVVHRQQSLSQAYERKMKRSVLSDPQMFFHYKQEHLDHLNADLFAFHLRFKDERSDLQRKENEMRMLLERKIEAQKHRIDRQRLSESMASFLWKKEQDLKSIPLHPQFLQQKMNYIQKELLKQKQKLLTEMQRQQGSREKHFAYLVKRLDDLSPLRLLSQGYLQAYREDEKVKSVEDLEVNDHLRLYLKDGLLETKVLGKEVYDE